MPSGARAPGGLWPIAAESSTTPRPSGGISTAAPARRTRFKRLSARIESDLSKDKAEIDRRQQQQNQRKLDQQKLDQQKQERQERERRKAKTRDMGGLEL